MARISGVPAGKTGLAARAVYGFTRHRMTQLTGRDPQRMTEPLELYAHAPGLLFGYAMLEWGASTLEHVDARLRSLAVLKASTLTNCEFCMDMGSQVARQSGLSDEQLLALPRYRQSELFSDLEKLVLDYAAGMSRTPVDVPEALFARMREHFNEAQIVELTGIIALENLRGRFNLALGVGAAGFSEGMVCALPIQASAATPPDDPAAATA